MNKDIEQLSEEDIEAIKENYVKWKNYMNLIYSQYGMSEEEVIQADLYRFGL